MYTYKRFRPTLRTEVLNNSIWHVQRIPILCDAGTYHIPKALLRHAVQVVQGNPVLCDAPAIFRVLPALGSRGAALLAGALDHGSHP